MVDDVIRPLVRVDGARLRELIIGYTTNQVYVVTQVETPESVRFELRLTPLGRPFVKRYPDPDPATAAHYAALAREGCCFGAFLDGRWVGIALAEPQQWNRSLWVHELHVASAYQGRGLGRRLVERLINEARQRGLRCLVCETQATNVPAIGFYRALGFVLDGLDLSHYTNHDAETGEVAVFMKLRLAGEP